MTMQSTHLFDSGEFRRVLGNFPTGVVAIAAIDESDQPVGMAVGSFTSVSLDPPLVAFLPAAASMTLPRILSSGKFGVSFLAEHQEDVCRALSARGGDKFRDVAWSAGRHGSPLIEDAVGWIECEIEAVHEAGDHFIVVGRVLELDALAESLPLLFFRGGYGKFLPQSFSAWGTDLRAVMRLADLSRPHLETALKATRSLECCGTSLVGDSVVVIASATSEAGSRRLLSSRVGARIPFYPPLGALFVAASTDLQLEESWVGAAAHRGEADAADMRSYVDRVRRQGYDERVGGAWHRHMSAIDAAGVDGRDPAARRRQLRIIDDALVGYTHAERGTALRSVGVPVVLGDGTVPLVLTAVLEAEAAQVAETVQALTSIARLVGATLGSDLEGEA